MTSLHHRRARRLPALWVAVMVAGAVFVLGGGSARASCGDWLQGHVPAGTPAVTAEDGSLANADVAPLRLPGNRPCNGPSCGRAPHVPPAPSEAPPTTLDLERDAILAYGCVDPLPGISRMTAIDDPFSASALCGRLDRPPRGV